MPHVISQACCGDARCVPVCPVQCIRPTPDDPDFASAEQLFIDPSTCVDCGACTEVCPVSAIYGDSEAPSGMLDGLLRLNAEHFQNGAIDRREVPLTSFTDTPDTATLSVAIVGTGPAACYVAEELIRHPRIRVVMFERLPTPFGLIRAGIAPDHQRVKSISTTFERVLSNPAVTCLFNVEVGRDVSIDTLRDHFQAVVWAGGMDGDRSLRIPGEQLPGTVSAREIVSWYNGHPDHCAVPLASDRRRVVVIGNGNVAMDVARMLLLPSDALRDSDMPAAAIAALEKSPTHEVIVAARRGPESAAFTTGELLALLRHPSIDVIAHAEEMSTRWADAPQVRRDLVLEAVARHGSRQHDKAVRLRFLVAPVRINGTTQVESVTFERQRMSGGRLVGTGSFETIEAGMVVKALGYTGRPIPGFPFDADRGTIANTQGRVETSDHQSLVGVYCAGWSKRGANGVLGTNKHCAEETVAGLLQDAREGRLPQRATADVDALLARVIRETKHATKWAGWRDIDYTERMLGRSSGRARDKLATWEELWRAVGHGVGDEELDPPAPASV